MPRLTFGRGPRTWTSQTPNMGIWDDLHVATWRGHPNRRRVLFRGHLTSQASLRAVRLSFCSTRFVQFARRCSSGTSQVNWSTDGVRYIIFSAACILQCRTLCSAIYVPPRAKEKNIHTDPLHFSTFLITHGDKCFDTSACSISIL